MASIKDYLVFRDQIKNGDLVLFRGSGVLAKLIQLVDNAFYNHVGIVFIANKRLFIIDSNAPGVAPDFLSHRMLQYKNFCIVRPQIWQEKDIDNAVSQIMSKAEEKHIGYNFLLLLQIAVYRLFKRKINLSEKGRNICSQFARRYTNLLVPQPVCYNNSKIEEQGFITPWDFIVFADNDFKIYFDQSDKSKYRFNF